MKTNYNIEDESNNLWYAGLLMALILCAIVLTARLVYLYVANEERFPITTIKVAATYKHVTHKELEFILAKYLNASFFVLPVEQLQNEFSRLEWIANASVERVWPDTLKIKLVEKEPIAVWSGALMTADGALFNQDKVPRELKLPKLDGPQTHQLDVLQVYEKLSKILSEYGLTASGLQMRENASWVLFLGNEIPIYLGKKEIEARLLRFCKAYPAVFAEKIDQLASVDLRYSRGMAVQWKQQTGR